MLSDYWLYCHWWQETMKNIPQLTITDEFDNEFEKHNPRSPLILTVERYSLGTPDAVVSVGNKIRWVNLNDEVLIITGVSGNGGECFELELPAKGSVEKTFLRGVVVQTYYVGPYPYLRGAVTVNHKVTTAGLEQRQSVRKKDIYRINQGNASSTWCEPMHLSACQVPNPESPIASASSYPSDRNKAMPAPLFTQAAADDVDGVDDISHALKQRHWVKRQSALASLTCETAGRLPTANSEMEHDIQPQQQINNNNTHITPPSIDLHPRKKPTATIQCLITNFTFQPENLEIEVGDSITWLLASNSDVAYEHQVIGRSFLPGLCFEGPIMGGAFSAKQFTKTITKPGQLTFYCDVVPEMAGKIIVRTHEESNKVTEECFGGFHVSPSVKESPQAMVGPEKMTEMAEVGARNTTTVPIPPLVGTQSITKPIKVRASENQVKLEATNMNIPEGGVQRMGNNNDFGSLDKENHRTYGDDGARDCVSPKPSLDAPSSLGSLLKMQKKNKKKKKKEKKRTLAPAVACKDNTYDNTVGDVRKKSSTWISPESSSRSLHDAAAAQTSESNKQMAINGSFQPLLSRHTPPPPRPHHEGVVSHKDRRGQEHSCDTDDLSEKIVIGGDHDETMNNFSNNNLEDGEGRVVVVPHVHPEAVSAGVGRALESNNRCLTVPPNTVGIKCGVVRAYTTKKGGERRNDNKRCHLKQSRNPESPSMVGVEGKTPFTKKMMTTTADGDDKIDNDRR